MQRLSRQFNRVLVHGINLLQRLLGNDIISVTLRMWLLRGLGARFTKRCKIMSGGYFHGGKLRRC